jgi:hypothetical protein
MDLSRFGSILFDCGVNVAHGNGFLNDQGSPQMYRLPGYPLFLAAGIKNCLVITRWLFFGYNCYYRASYRCSFLCWRMFYFIMIRLHALQYWLLLFMSGFGVYATMVSTETLFLIFFLLFLIMFFRKAIIFDHFFVRVLCLVLPPNSSRRHYTLVVSLFLLLFMNVSLPIRAQRMLCLSLGWFLMVLPWLVRNFLLTGALFFHTLPGHHFLQFSAAYVVMERDHSE